ncbi:MAG: four helix bundle protein [Ignavibacteriae bacterium]|nr:four helix bundle protein [Ignavibacteriota bacterium]
MAGADQIFEISTRLPTLERFALVDQIRRSSRSVCANLAEAWAKRQYRAAFIAKLSDAEAEARETQTWIEFLVRCRYLDTKTARKLYASYDEVISMLVSMRNNPEKWLLL